MNGELSDDTDVAMQAAYGQPAGSAALGLAGPQRGSAAGRSE